MKSKKCRICATPFDTAFSTRVVCSVACSLRLVERNKAKRDKLEQANKRKRIREAKERIKTRSQWMKEAQAIVNKYVRLRDSRHGCISCGKSEDWSGQWHASHFRSIGAAPHLRFNLWNIHKACSICNNHLSGNIMFYRPALIEKIGIEKVEWLESCHDRAGFTVEYLSRIKAVFRKKTKRLEARLGDQHE